MQAAKRLFPRLQGAT